MKRLILLFFLAISASIYSFPKPSFEGLWEEGLNVISGNDLCLEEDDRCGDIYTVDYNDVLKNDQQSGRNPKNKKRGKNTKKKSKEKSSKKDSKKKTAKNSPRKVSPRKTPKRTTPKKKHNSEMGIGLYADVFGGYSNFMWDDGTPVAGLGFGAGLTGKFHLNEVDYSPDGYFAELGVNYKRKGSGAYPIDYVNAQLLPLAYSFNHLFGEFSLFIKAGGYVAYPFSKIKTNSQSFDTNLDYGAMGCVGVSYEKLSVSVSYEHGFADVCDAKVSLKNQNIFLTLSYRLF